MDLRTHRLTPAIGATVEGIDWSSGISEGLADVIHERLMEHQVLFFRDAHLTATQMTDLASSLGTLGIRHHSYKTVPDAPDVSILEWGGPDGKMPDAAEWHTDMTYRANPPFASMLQAMHLPPSGGDTLWASMYAVYDALSPGLREDLADLLAVHDMGAFRTPAYEEGGNEGIDQAMKEAGSAAQPMIAYHPVTGRPYLNVSESFTRFIIGFSAPESGRLLTHLFDLINRPEFHVRLKWELGTVAIWDNRATQHYAVADYLPHLRILHRVAMVEDHRTPTG